MLFAQDANVCDQPGEAPDIIVGDLWGGIMRFGTVGGISGFSFGTDACNVGTCWTNFIAGSTQHPIIAQNMFRLKDGRIEQIGQSWVKHTFGADQNVTCSNSCIPSPDFSHLGVNCSDAYLASTNGSQGGLGPKSEINPSTGAFPYPFREIYRTGNAIYKRLQVHVSDLNPALNPGALYFMEAQYIAPDDAGAGHGANNCSYRRAAVLNGGQVFNLEFRDQTRRNKPAIEAWRDSDPSVFQTIAGVADNGIYVVASKATFMGQGIWHYEYAVQNIDVSRSAASFSVPIPAGTHLSNIGFHDVDYHSGEAYDGLDWMPTLSGGSLTWTVQYEVGSANWLSWGTLYNFRFDADVPPGTHPIELNLFHDFPTLTPPGPNLATTMAITPNRCDSDGVCDPGEDCASCPADCVNQHGGTGCCGNLICEQGEDATGCFADCGTAAASETQCGNGIDDDRDGLLDCMDPDCCTNAACDALDLDGDAHATCDCNDADAQVWATPDEIQNLWVTSDPEGTTVLLWDAATGGHPAYDVIRAPNPADFEVAGTCTYATVNALLEYERPWPGGVFSYLVRGRNACPNGVGTLGTDSAGQERIGPSCP